MTYPPASGAASARSRLIVPVLGLGQIAAFASSYYLLGVLADPIARGLGVSSSRLFLALSLAFLVAALASPAAGRWIDARGGRLALIVSNLVFATALCGLGAAPDIRFAMAAIALLGLAMAIGLYGTAFAVLVDLHGDAARRPITAVSLIGGFGGALGWPISLALMEHFGWRGACFGWAALHLFVCLPLTSAVLPTHVAPVARSRDRISIGWDGRMIRLAILFAGAWLVSTALGAHLPRLLGRLGLSAAEAAAAAGLMSAAAITIRLLDLTLLRRSHPVLTARIATLLHPLGALIAVVGGKSFAGAVALGQGAGNGLLSVASGVLPLHLFGRDHYAARHALLLTPARFLQAAAPLAYGLALDRSAGFAVAMSSGVCLIMFAATFGLDRSSQAPGPRPD
jgi:MFS family permease